MLDHVPAGPGKGRLLQQAAHVSAARGQDTLKRSAAYRGPGVNMVFTSCGAGTQRVQK